MNLSLYSMTSTLCRRWERHRILMRHVLQFTQLGAAELFDQQKTFVSQQKREWSFKYLEFYHDSDKTVFLRDTYFQPVEYLENSHISLLCGRKQWHRFRAR